MPTKTNALLSCLLLLVACAAAEARAAEGDEPPKGRVVESVTVARDPAQHYALYLPASYTRARKHPVLYCFDPGGRGAVPVERFREAAERFGYIVVGSNNSRNGPVAPSVAAARAVWADTRARLSIDDRRLYAAGFSGGARQAVRLNQLCRNCLAGVIACGAGFPPELEPRADARFALYALAGVEDFNFPELKLLDERLARLSFPHRLRVFDGAHQWAPARELTEAVEWMELRAMREARRARDEKFIGELWDRRRAEADTYASAGKLYDAYLARLSLAEDFAELRDASSEAAEASRLATTKEVKKALAEEREQIGRQRALFDQIRALRDGDVRAFAEENDARLPPTTDFRQAVRALRKAADGKEDTGERRVARRTRRQLFAFYYESAANLRARNVESGRVVENLEAAAEFAPDDPRLHFELACAYASDRQKKKALATLKRATELGFDDADAITSSDALAPLRTDDAFKEILTRLRTKP